MLKYAVEEYAIRKMEQSTCVAEIIMFDSKYASIRSA